MTINELAEWVCFWGMLVPLAIACWGVLLIALCGIISDIKNGR